MCLFWLLSWAQMGISRILLFFLEKNRWPWSSDVFCVSPFLSPDSAGQVLSWPGGHFWENRLLSPGQQQRHRVTRLVCTGGVGEALVSIVLVQAVKARKERAKVICSLFPLCRMNVLATNDASYLKTCRYSQEHPYCPIFVLGNIVRWAGGDFQEMASEVGESLGLLCLPSWLPAHREAVRRPCLLSRLHCRGASA